MGLRLRKEWKVLWGERGGGGPERQSRSGSIPGSAKEGRLGEEAGAGFPLEKQGDRSGEEKAGVGLG